MTLKYDYRVQAKANHVCHMIWEETGKVDHPSPKLRSDVEDTMMAAVNYYKVALDNELQKKNEYKLNELRRGIHRLKPNSHEDIIDLFAKVMAGESVQTMKPYKRERELV
ncbi:hypothetical protein CPT_Moonbeam198 [Bacillus phage Moonbeam]|uniref:Uncharacterized protein n=1 Tax=Bacillus phage Moonbeam TaxID=1540091 RepID=A0A0A0RST0_9CAUD|nr:hypothetical protein CPT_Moonbeam198 [Bacillus phage Moonbeam]AIW03596.1 hypothetical protein CPT_Moonbeam198 [Bacillus phage Moonbeam]